MMRAFLCLAAMCSLLLSGCSFRPEDRKPIPVVAITVLSEPGVYMLDDKRLYLSNLETALQKIADENRRPVGNTVRAYVRIAYARSVPYSSVEEIIGLCSSMGLDKIDVIARDGEPPRSTKTPK